MLCCFLWETAGIPETSLLSGLPCCSPYSFLGGEVGLEWQLGGSVGDSGGGKGDPSKISTPGVLMLFPWPTSLKKADVPVRRHCQLPVASGWVYPDCITPTLCVVRSPSVCFVLMVWQMSPCQLSSNHCHCYRDQASRPVWRMGLYFEMMNPWSFS